jgi:multicomponent K+:H+ antiporter subunit G
MTAIFDWLLSALVVTGVFFALVGAIGLVKLSNFLMRLHGPTKASTLGVGCVLVASMVYFSLTGEASLHELLITLFIFMTAPIAAHLMVKAALRADPTLAPPDPPPAQDNGRFGKQI